MTTFVATIEMYSAVSGQCVIRGSWEDLAQTVALSANPWPEVPYGAAFYAVDDWWTRK